MRLFSGKVPVIAQELVTAMTTSGAIEVQDSEMHEVQLDVESVLKEYIRAEREITDRARDIIAAQKRDYTELRKIKSQIAKEKGFQIDDDAIEYLTAQLIETLIHSRHVEEVYGMDNELTLQITPVLRKHLAADEELDNEVRRRIQNLQEGTSAWDVQYGKIKEELKRTRNLGH
ncbi:MAG: DUF507 family protein [Deltaproteobacteria bacterium]|nr:DUF507 family protein [Deltaproteobacteria bacterium]